MDDTNAQRTEMKGGLIILFSSDPAMPETRVSPDLQLFLPLNSLFLLKRELTFSIFVTDALKCPTLLGAEVLSV